MARLVIGVAAVVLLFHGLIHLMGTTVYMKLGKVEGLSYKTTLLGGRWDLGEGGIRVFGALWILPALGFAVAASALWGGWPSWRPLLLSATVFSLALTALDWAQAYAGVAVNLVILFAVVLGPRLAASFGR
jgi:hypothetical protein